ncbi:ABC transporter ATP-binding protein [Treponema bryantii]|uniref:ABC transporter ATP-binding protein n=1 Tax=Treponema bryantii TaxID=163 RepID=UPI0003B5CFA6|nr:ABC transporter ATP-binding protein [Treponema bryantii]
MSELKIQNLSASYGDKIVLSGVSFSLQQSDFVCLCGPNGAGKSTLLSVMAGVADAGLKASGQVGWFRYDALHHSTTGASEIMVVECDAKRRVSKPPRHELARLIAFMQQNEYSEWNFLVHDYVLQGRYAYTKRSLFGAGPANYAAADYEVVDKVLRELGLSDFSQRYIHELSGGEFQKIRLARALAQTPCFLLLDEPAANLDYVYEPHLMQLLRDTAHKRNLGILAAVHDINLAVRFADKILLLPPAGRTMDSKKSVLFGSPSDIMNTDNLKYTFGVDFECKEIKSFQSLQ